MMLQRKDLANEFSLIVQQEIKNHNDMILASHMALEEFRRKIEEIADISNERIRSLNNDIAEKFYKIADLETRLDNSISQVNRAFNDRNALINSHLEGIKKSMEARESYFLTIDGFKEFEAKIDQWVAHLKLSFNAQRSYFNDEMKNVSDIIAASLNEYKKQIVVRFAEEARKRDEINKALDFFALNFSGTTRELELCKKRCFIIEKNIENLYIQIERLKAGKS